MKLETVEVRASPRTPDTVRVQGSVSYGRGRRELLWFDYPAEYENRLGRSGTPWLAVLLPWAATRNERLEVFAPVDPRFSRNAQEILRIWRSWPGRVGHVDLHCPKLERSHDGTESIEPFTCGVDSFYTLVRAPHRITHLMTVHGLDIKLKNKIGFRKVLDSVRNVAAAFGAEAIPVATNLRRSDWAQCSYAELGHGPALLAMALALSPRRVLFASSHFPGSVAPWGSHPRTDPLFSTRTTAVVHHGNDVTRTAKMEAIVANETAMRHLRVCFRSPDEKNCGACEKCYRTMLTLHLLGALDRCGTFRASLDLDRVSRIYAGDRTSRLFAAEVRDLAARLGNRRIDEDMATAMDRSLRIRSRIESLGRVPLLRLHRLYRGLMRWRCIH